MSLQPQQRQANVETTAPLSGSWFIVERMSLLGGDGWLTCEPAPEVGGHQNVNIGAHIEVQDVATQRRIRHKDNGLHPPCHVTG